jgi:hypothetical protein
MPWSVISKDGKHCVYKAGGELVKCHDSKEKAVAHARALYANVHEGIAEFSMAIVKANIKDGEMRWRAVCSDVEEDVYGERMSTELFQDFIKHIQDEDDIPEPFKSVISEDDWDGGNPYISIAHYKSGKGKVNVPGEPKNIFLDGKALKSTGILYDTPLGRSVYKSLTKDLVEKREDKIRISIGFLDLEHSHGDRYTFTRKALTDKCPLCKEGVGDKIYKKGHLVHLALTRVPANPRTDVEVTKSMTTKREDAESIIEDEEVIKGLDLKSQADDVLVIKSEEETPAVEKLEVPVENTGVSQASTVVTTSHFNEKGEVEKSTTTVIPISESTPLEKSLATLKDRVVTLKSQGLTGEQALQEIQTTYEEVGHAIKAEFTTPPTPQEIANQNLEATLRSLLSEMLPTMLAQTVAPIQSQQEEVNKTVNELRALSLTKQASTTIKKEEVVPQPRSITPNLVQKSAVEAINKKLDSFDIIAQRSVGIQV